MSQGIVVTTVVSDSEEEDFELPLPVKPATQKSRRHTSTTKSEEESLEDPKEVTPEEEEDEYEDEDDEEEDTQDWVPVQLSTPNKDQSSLNDSSEVSDISDEPSSSEEDESSSEASSVSEAQDFLSNQNMYHTDEDPNTLSLIESIAEYNDEEDDDLLEDDEFMMDLKSRGASNSEDEEIYNSGHQHLMSTEMLAPLEPPISAKEPLVFASDMLARRYNAGEDDDDDDVESTKQQDPLDSPYARLRKMATLEKVIDSNHHRKEINKSRGNGLPPPPPHSSRRKEQEEDDEEKKRNEFMAWRREGIPEYIEFVFGTDDCPTDDEDEAKPTSSSKHKKTKQPPPARRRLNPPPPPPTAASPKPVVGGEPVPAVPVHKKNSFNNNNKRMPSNARDMSGNNNKEPETKIQGLYKKYRIRASKSGASKTFQRSSDVSGQSKQKEEEKQQQQKQRHRSLSPMRGSAPQSFKSSTPNPTADDQIAMLDGGGGGGGERGKLSAKKSFSKIKKGGAKKFQSLRSKLMGGHGDRDKSTEPIPYQSGHSERTPNPNSKPHRSSAPDPVKAVPVVALKRGRSTGRLSTGGTKNSIPRRTAKSRDTSVDENPYNTQTTTGGRKGRRVRASTSPRPSRSVNTASGKVQPASAADNVTRSPRVPNSFRRQASLRSVNSFSSGPSDLYTHNKTPQSAPTKSSSLRVKSAPDIPSPGGGARRGRRSGGRPNSQR